MIKVLPLGAGQDVGRSCLVITIKDKTIVFDTGIHMLYNDQRRYPDFSLLYKPPQTINEVVHLVLITHFHLDHCGALPYLTQYHKYTGPIYASTPTKAMIPFMLEDYRKVTVDVKKQENPFYVYTNNEVLSATSKIQSIGLFETINIDGIQVTSYYAGHVLGACMFFVEYNGLSVLYTGDYNSYADRHLGAASLPKLNPNIIITETTYATTIRDTKRDRERAMLKIITETLEGGGKVLIPVFALGRAQELSVLLETYWNRTDNTIPIYFSAGLIDKANLFYRLFVDWENEKIQEQFQSGENVFEFKKVKPFDKSLIRAEHPYVLFATPGMLHGGTSMQVFKQWCGDERNTLIIPGYCVQGTLGNKLLKGVKEINIDKKQYQVKMKIANVSFSAHADAKGIINLIRNINAQNIVFVHGDKQKMEIFAEIVKEQLQKTVYMPANHKQIVIKCTRKQEIIIEGEYIPTEGYLMKKSNSISKQYCLLQEKDLLKEVNKMMQIMGDESGYIVEQQIDCHYYLQNESKELIEPLIGKHSGLLQFSCCEVKKQSIKQQQESQKDSIEIKGNIQAVSMFLKQLKVLKRRQK